MPIKKYKNNSERIKAIKEQKRIYSRKYYKKNPEKVKEYRKKYYLKNKKKENEYAKKYSKTHYLKNKEKYIESNKKYRKTQKYRDARNKQRRNRRKTDPNFRIRERISVEIWNALKTQKVSKNMSIDRTIGCSISHLRKHLEAKFKKGMSWENYGKLWHIDHIIPTSLVDLKIESNQKFVFNYKNFQPLWAKDNMKKSNKISIPISKSQTIGELDSFLRFLTDKFKRNKEFQLEILKTKVNIKQITKI